MHHLWAGVLPRQVFADAPPDGFDAPVDPAYVGTWPTWSPRTPTSWRRSMVEPVVQGAGGMRFHTPGYLRALREIADAHDVLLIFDEIATGFGRTGELFAAEHAGVAPDVMCVGKAMTGGYLTMAATLCTRGSPRASRAGRSPVLAHGPTFMGNPLAGAVAQRLDRPAAGRRLAGDVARIEAGLRAGLAPAARDARRARRAGARGDRRGAARPRGRHGGGDAAAAVERGVWLRPFRDLVYTMPPYVTGDEDLAAISGAVVAAARASAGCWLSATGLGWLAEALGDLRDRDLLRVLTYCPARPTPRSSSRACRTCCSPPTTTSASPTTRPSSRARGPRWRNTAPARAPRRLVTGSLDLHRRLEERIAALKGCEDALVFPTGFQANVGTIPALVGRGDVVFCDELNHASLIDGCRLSGAEVVRFPTPTPTPWRRAVRSTLIGRRPGVHSSAGHRGGASSSPTRCSPWTATSPRYRRSWRSASGTDAW